MTRKKDILKEKMEVIPLDNYLIEQKNVDQLKIYTKQKLKDVINEVLSELEPLEQKVLRLKYGFDNEIPKKYKEIAEEINETPEIAQRIVIKALNKLKHPTRTRKLRGFLYDD